MEVQKIIKKMRFSKSDIVKYQLLTNITFLKKQTLIQSDVEILTILAVEGPIELGKFCNNVTKKLYTIKQPEEFSLRSQNIRNRLNKLIKRNIVLKDESAKRIIKINPEFEIITKGNILLDLNFLSIESN